MKSLFGEISQLIIMVLVVSSIAIIITRSVRLYKITTKIAKEKKLEVYGLGIYDNRIVNLALELSDKYAASLSAYGLDLEIKNTYSKNGDKETLMLVVKQDSRKVLYNLKKVNYGSWAKSTEQSIYEYNLNIILNNYAYAQSQWEKLVTEV